MEIGESDAEMDKMMMELEMECLQVYRRKVDEASNIKARLHQSVTAKEAELAVLRASLGEFTPHSPNIGSRSLKEQLASVTPLLDDLRVKKEERIKQFADLKLQLEKINWEISGYNHGADTDPVNWEEHDLSLRKLNEYHAQLRTLQKEKSDRLHKVLEYVNEVHSLCGVLGLDFGKTVSEVHPSLQETGIGQSTNISNTTLEGLSLVVMKLKAEKRCRTQKLKDTVTSLFELWSLMDTPEKERRCSETIASVLGSPEQEIIHPGVLSLDIIEQVEAEVERLTKLKASRMKELVLKRRSELEEICRRAHIEPDTSTAPEKSNALIDSGLVDPSELLSQIESQITSVKDESVSRKELMDRVEKWLAACEEENWLEEYNQDVNRYSAQRGVHLNLKRAERARIIVTKLPSIIDNLMNKTFTWEEERNKPFLYDGVRLVAILEEYKLRRQQKEEAKKRYRDQKKSLNLLLAEKESMYGSKPTPKRSSSFNRKTSNLYNAYGNGKGSMTPMPRRGSIGGATPELLTPRSHSGRQNGYFRDTRRSSTTPLKFMGVSKADTMSYASVSIYGSELGSPRG
ncbi:65-kDa microtubule-associated protein 6 [Acorus gramineus]|uniref:65-kDa microtubule-associated protein 6 n=1 Tax=Acorus gramineus TaxID=55184 RepID=A0AAV9AGX9_ACOGR|nr:65-kDa microtubule-associated protein 6 [Acorus gramineus]